MKYKPNVRYIRKIGTTDCFPWTPGLAARPDMEEYDPFSQFVHKNPELPEKSFDPFTEQVSGLDRAHVREGLSQCQNKLQKIFWCLLNLWEKSPGLLAEFLPRYRDLSILMGPTFTKEELHFALEIFRSNPNKEYLMSEAVNEQIPADFVQ